MENRAAVFTSSPQDVEIYRDGAWWPGSLLGWRHDADGGCQVWVRLVTGAAEETSWTALDRLRLPEPEAPSQPVGLLATVDSRLGASAGGDAALTGTMTAIRAVPVPRPRPGGSSPARSGFTATTDLHAARALADEPVAATAVSATPVPAGPRSGGRHRAPAPESGASGRHRATDTGVGPAVRGDGTAGMPEASSSTSSISAVALESPFGSDAHLYTRPMRLDDLAGRTPLPRRARRDGWLAGR
jgi:hypothetical protein